MNSYIRDDGVEMVETRPGCFTRRDSLGLLDLAPMARRAAAAAEPPPIVPTHEDLAPEPVEAPPLQPSHDDLAAAAPAPKPPRAPRPKPAKRPIEAILAEAARTHRARGLKVRA